MLIVDIRPKPIKKRTVRQRPRAKVKKFSIFGIVLTALVLTLASLPLIFAFEAHVINVTAQIEGCDKFEIRSRGFWKNHADLWSLPQTVGPEYVDTAEEAEEILNNNDTMYDKLARELLALKFNIAHFGVGNALVPGEDIRIDDLAWEADQLLVQEANDPDSVTDQELEDMKDRVQKTNNAKKVSTCKEPPKECDDFDFPDFWGDSSGAEILGGDHDDGCGCRDGGDGHSTELMASGDGGDGGIIITGDACAESEIENIVNTNITEIDTCEGDCSGGGGADVENQNEAVVENTATTTAETGGNSANGGDGSAIEDLGITSEEATSTPESPLPPEESS